MAYMTNREFAEHEYKRRKQNAYADALVKEVRWLREENELLQAQLAEYEALAAEYGIDGQTMLTLAKSQIKTTQSNIELQDKINILESGLINLKENGFCATCTGCNAPHDPNRTTWCTSWEYKHE